METERNWKAKTLLAGGLLGALAGVAAAYLLVRRAEASGGRPRLGAGEGVRLGVLLLGRSVR